MERKPVLLLAVFLMASIPLVPLELGLLQHLIDRVQSWSESDSMQPLLLGAGLLAGLMALSNIVIGVPVPMAMTRLIEIGTLEGQRLILRKSARLPMDLAEAPSTKNLRERAMQVSLHEVYDTSVNFVHTAGQLLLLMLILLFYGQWLPALLMVAAVPLLLRASGQTAFRVESLEREQTEDRRLANHYAGWMTRREAAKEVRLFGMGALLMRRWGTIHETLSGAKWRTMRGAELRRLGPEIGMAVGTAVILALVVFMPASRDLTAGEFALVFLASTKWLTTLPTLLEQGRSLRQAVMRWEDYRTFMELREEPSQEHDQPDLEGYALAKAHAGTPELGYSRAGLRLEVRSLRFRYPGADRDVLNNLSFTIPVGCRAALVGENGSGKSTLIKVLTGLYPPTDGTVTWLDDAGCPISANSPAPRISAVFQDFARFYLTLRENVALGQLNAMDQDSVLRHALRQAGAGDAFQTLDMQLGPSFGGIEPSGGEWQKIATARALVREAGFVFFDEPTAALDPLAEKEAFELFLRVTERRSALLVTHRLGAARLADLILVLKDGDVVERGTHEELMRLRGEYCRMFELQAAWYA